MSKAMSIRRPLPGPAPPRISPTREPPGGRHRARPIGRYLGKAQAVVGRGENQLNYAINLAQSQLTNFQTAESRIRDADLASEAANLTKAQILLQAGVAALAQANSAPQVVLSLLKG